MNELARFQRLSERNCQARLRWCCLREYERTKPVGQMGFALELRWARHAANRIVIGPSLADVLDEAERILAKRDESLEASIASDQNASRLSQETNPPP